MNDDIWTESKGRLRFAGETTGNYNWVFIPGGPGLGSDYLQGLTDHLDLPGTLWHFDFPEDGSNHFDDTDFTIKQWFDSLHQVTDILENVILVGHSTGGMLTLATPELEGKLKGLVLMSSAPDASWQKSFAKYVKDHPLPQTAELHNRYVQAPSNNLLKELTISCASYVSLPENLDQIIAMMKVLPFNYKAHLLAEENFDSTYKAAWIPQTIPTLILSGNKDYLTPLSLFSERREFERANILLRQVHNAAHYPWVDNLKAVKEIFRDFAQKLES